MRQSVEIGTGTRNHRRWLRTLVPPALLFVSAAVAFTLPSGQLGLLLLALGPMVIAGLVYLRYPAIGLLGMVAAGLLIPFGIGTGTQTALNPVVLLVPVLTAAWLLDSIIRRQGIHFHPHRSIILLLALSSIAVLSAIVGQLPWFTLPGASISAQIGGLMVFLVSGAAFLVAAHTLDERWLQRLVYLFLAIAAAYLASRLAPPVARTVDRLVETGAVGSVFFVWTVSLSAGLALFQTSLPIGRRFLLAGLAVLAVAVPLFLFGSWASGWAPSLVALIVLVTLKNRQMGLLLIALSTVVFLARFDQAMSLATDTESWSARQQAWQIVLDTAAANPLLGLGPANYYSYVEQASIFGWGSDWNVRFSSHNNFVDLVAQTGIIGLLLFLAFAVSVGRLGLAVFRREPGDFPHAYAAACLAGLFGTLASGMLGDWFLPFVYNVGLDGMRSSILFWVFTGGLVALAMTGERD